MNHAGEAPAMLIFLLFIPHIVLTEWTFLLPPEWAKQHGEIETYLSFCCKYGCRAFLFFFFFYRLNKSGSQVVCKCFSFHFQQTSPWLRNNSADTPERPNLPSERSRATHEICAMQPTAYIFPDVNHPVDGAAQLAQTEQSSFCYGCRPMI